MLIEHSSGDQFAEIDVSDWLPAHEEILGTKPKRWLQDPGTGTLWLMKDQTFNGRKDGSRCSKGDASPRPLTTRRVSVSNSTTLNGKTA